ncbi:MAG: DNA methyltransferase [Nostocales cyanobacterium 94392]|nr:DNA methyltransferase [Nostocales cyanobacterium 94392]
MKEFDKPIKQELLNIAEKKRSNLFSWRGQFSPQLVETIFEAYCLPSSVVLDPFVGSGTVLLEAGACSLEAYGVEINPAAWMLSKTYEFINKPDKKNTINQIRDYINQEFPFSILIDTDKTIDDLEAKVNNLKNILNKDTEILFNALIILLDVGNNTITNNLIQSKVYELMQSVDNLPISGQKIFAYLSDCRWIPLPDNKIDFVVTSPPYINVFNYHQNYRKSAEILGWDLLKIAKSEIGANRANRANRFYTVVQYCLDIGETLKEISRVSKKDARIVFVVGYESTVLGVPFYNADIIEKIAIKSGMYAKVLRQKRKFKNKFGKIIREDLINFTNLKVECTKESIDDIAREVAHNVLKAGINLVCQKNLECLENAIEKVMIIKSTPKLDLTEDVYQLQKAV